MKSLAELTELREKSLATVNMRQKHEISAGDGVRAHVLLCGGTGCLSSNSEKLRDRLANKLEELGIADEIKIVMTGCFGLCAEGPIVVVYPEGAMYAKVSPKDIDLIAEEHLLRGNVVEKLLIGSGVEHFDEDGAKSDDADFFAIQKRVALRNCGRINPEDITEYIAFDGYQALGKVLTEMTPQQVIDEIKASGLSRLPYRNEVVFCGCFRRSG